MQRDMVWLSAQVPYGQAQVILERIGGWAVGSSTLWEQTQQHGERLRETVQSAHPQAGSETSPEEESHAVGETRKAVSMDGGMVHVREEGWKEIKIGLVADVPRVDCTQAEPVHLTRMQYMAVLGSVEAFAPALRAFAVFHGVPHAPQVVVTADGALWIWRLADTDFPDAVQVVDWYHACQHLAQAAQARFPTDALAAQRWLRELKDLLFKGDLPLLTASLRLHGLASAATYFETHAHRMRYAQFQADGLPIGSGAVESGVKQFKQRLAGPGMRWSRPALDRMIVLRAAVLGGSFDSLWLAA